MKRDGKHGAQPARMVALSMPESLENALLLPELPENGVNVAGDDDISG